MLNIIVEEKGVYDQELIVPSMNFEPEVLDWSTKSYACNCYNVMSPNSIVFWDAVNQDPITKKFEDLLVFTYSEADKVSKVINIRGILDYVLKLYEVKDIEETFIPSKNSDAILGKTLSCVKDYAMKVCKDYGLEHPMYEQYAKEKREKEQKEKEKKDQQKKEKEQKDGK